ncbi:MAG TPA: tetratricopeptide repeat protein [Tepidisphaeraceae bacterium]|jgi:hypothetical protein|nr:tetratricopeptide repeat protein [Tepidisphaeraceae bacterium]
MGTEARDARTRLASVLAVLIVALWAVGFAVVPGRRFGDARQSAPSLLGPGLAPHEGRSNGGIPVDVPLGLLCDYYEHGFEHAPPRDPRGVMQRRETFYRPPPPPAEFLRSKIGTSVDDRRLQGLVDRWEADWLAGHPPAGAIIAQLQEAAGRSSLDAIALIEAAKGFEFLEGDQLAAAFFDAALLKAEPQYALTQPGDPAALPLLHELDQTKALWRLKDYPALERRFRLARRLYAPLSVESRRSGYLLVDALFYQDRFDEAADLILAVQAEHRRVGDLGLLESSDLYEMNYEQGFLLFSAGRFEAAIPLLKLVSGRGEHDQVAEQALFRALLQTGHFDQARVCLADLLTRFKLAPWSQAALARELDESIQQDQWRRQTLASTDP